MTTKADDPAFPVANGEEIHPDFAGLTKREYLLGQVISGWDYHLKAKKDERILIAFRAVRWVDELIAALNEGEEG